VVTFFWRGEISKEKKELSKCDQVAERNSNFRMLISSMSTTFWITTQHTGGAYSLRNKQTNSEEGCPFQTARLHFLQAFSTPSQSICHPCVSKGFTTFYTTSHCIS